MICAVWKGPCTSTGFSLDVTTPAAVLPFHPDRAICTIGRQQRKQFQLLKCALCLTQSRIRKPKPHLRTRQWATPIRHSVIRHSSLQLLHFFCTLLQSFCKIFAKILHFTAKKLIHLNQSYKPLFYHIYGARWKLNRHAELKVFAADLRKMIYL